MTKPSVTVSVKIPARILEHIPPPGHGRSGFIVRAIEEKLARKKTTTWKPTTARGRRLAALLEQGKDERGPDLTVAELEAELRERRGGFHIAAAMRLGAEEFYTSEKPGKPMFRVRELKIISLHSL